jgi:hypothetical protein
MGVRLPFELLVLFWAALAALVASLEDAFVVCDVLLVESSIVSATAGALLVFAPRCVGLVDEVPPEAALSALAVAVSSAVGAGAAVVPSVPLVSLLEALAPEAETPMATNSARDASVVARRFTAGKDQSR